MENERRRIGARSTQFQLWVAAFVMADQTKRPVTEILPKVLKTFEDTVRQTDLRGTRSLQDKFEQACQRARDARQIAGGIDVDNPAVIRMVAGLKTDDDSASETEPPPPESTESFLADHFPDATARAEKGEDDLDFLYDDIPETPLEMEGPEEGAPETLAKQQAALEKYCRFLHRHTKIPFVPCSRPDLGVTFFPTGRFDVGGVDWNYNGQVGGEMIRDCKEDKLVFSRGTPLKAILEFKDWSFSKTQKVSGTIWVWAVRHAEGKAMRFWFNDGDDRLRFYYTMTGKGVTQVQKKPESEGSKKFITVAERHLTSPDLDA